MVQADQGPVGGLALQARAPARGQRRLGQAAQPVGAGAAGQAKAQTAVGLAAAVDLHLAARKRAAQRCDLQAFVAGLDPTTGIGQRRQVRAQPQVVALQLHAGLDHGVGRVRERDVEAQLELGIAAGAGLGQGVSGPAAQQRGVQVAQQVGQRATGLAVDLQQGLVRELADAALHLAQLHPPKPATGGVELHRIALEQQLPADARKRGPEGRVGGRRPGQRGGDGLGSTRHGRECHVLQLASDAELTVLPVDVRKVPEITLDAVAHLPQFTALHRLLHPGAGVGVDAQRQVAGHPVGAALGQAAAQLQHPRQPAAFAKAGAGAALPGGVERAARVGIVEAGVVHLELDARAGLGGRCPCHGCCTRRCTRRHRRRGPRCRPRRLDAPGQLGRQMRQRQAGLLEHARQFERTVAELELGLAAGLVRTDHQVGAVPAGPADAARLWRGCGSNRQGPHLGLHAEGPGRVERAVPACGHRLHRAFGVELVQQAAQAGAYRQALGQVGERGQVESVGAELTAGHRVAGADLGQAGGLGLAPAHRQLAGRPIPTGVAVGTGGKAQAAHGQLDAGGRALGHKTPAQALKGQRVQVWRKAHRDLAQRCIQGQRLRQALVPIDPGPQPGLALLHVHRQTEVMAQLRHIDPGQVGKHLALPVLPVAGRPQ